MKAKTKSAKVLIALALSMVLLGFSPVTAYNNSKSKAFIKSECTQCENAKNYLNERGYVVLDVTYDSATETAIATTEFEYQTAVYLEAETIVGHEDLPN